MRVPCLAGGGRDRRALARLGLRPGDAALPRRARDRAGRRFEVLERQPFGGPLFVRFGDAVHVLGGALARRDQRGARGREPAATLEADPRLPGHERARAVRAAAGARAGAL